MRERDTLMAAANWFVDLLTAPDLNQLWPQFERWLQESVEHRCAYERIERSWSKGDGLPRPTPHHVPSPRVGVVLH
jgi:ferric-dicitrate binding protein FerR (iron transport regulator)